MKRSRPLRVKTPLRTFTRLRPVNPRRAAERYERDFGAKAVWIRSLPCVGCLRPGPSIPHHVRSRGAGGTKDDMVPLCRACHDEGHNGGWKTWERGAGITLRIEAERLDLEWRLRAASTP